MKQPRSCCKLYKFCSFALTNSSNILGQSSSRWGFLLWYKDSGRSLRVSEITLDTTYCLYIELILQKDTFNISGTHIHKPTWKTSDIIPSSSSKN
ncbi:unnamed protein product [Citrullus colocynthis]|uniref:Uncharacterized protein n=1 Tax=Citrullus colocynthis TaxID=252529 RepID=A0ABP0Y8R1_9ROSI